MHHEERVVTMNDIIANPHKPSQNNKGTPAVRARGIKLTSRQVGMLAVVGIVIVAVVAVYVMRSNQVNKSGYQLVSLANGQAYIGRLKNSPYSGYLHLEDVYTIQAGTSTTESAAAQPQLVKLTDQLAGSENEIFLSKNQVVFWENLRADSKVTKAIQQAD
jgi:hypothetical protein